MVQGPGSGHLSSAAPGLATRRVVLARHGQTDWNRDHRYQGHGDPPLNQAGLAQAAVLAEELAGLGLGALATSDLARARQTAATVEARTGLVAQPCARFREVDLGTWEGLTEAEVAARHPAELAAWKAGLPVRRGGGESEEAAGRRFVAALDRFLAGTAPDEPVAVVAHGLVLRRAMAQLVDAGRVRLPGPAPHLANGQWRLLDLAPSQTVK